MYFITKEIICRYITETKYEKPSFDYIIQGRGSLSLSSGQEGLFQLIPAVQQLSQSSVPSNNKLVSVAPALERGRRPLLHAGAAGRRPGTAGLAHTDGGWRLSTCPSCRAWASSQDGGRFHEHPETGDGSCRLLRACAPDYRARNHTAQTQGDRERRPNPRCDECQRIWGPCFKIMIAPHKRWAQLITSHDKSHHKGKT